MEGIIGLLVGYVICKVLAGGEGLLNNLFHASHPSSAPTPPPSPALTTTAVSFSTAVPAGLPSWPGGWKAVSPVTAAHVSRAKALLPVMKLNDVKYEQGPAGSWLAYFKHQFSGKTGVTVHEPKLPPPAPQPAAVNVVSPAAIPAAAQAPAPVNVQSPAERAFSPSAFPEPGPAPTSSPTRQTLRKGSRGDAVKAWQRIIGVEPDGNFGKGTDAATRVWQRSHGLTPDGVVGRDTGAAAGAAS